MQSILFTYVGSNGSRVSMYSVLEQASYDREQVRMQQPRPGRWLTAVPVERRSGPRRRRTFPGTASLRIRRQVLLPRSDVEFVTVSTTSEAIILRDQLLIKAYPVGLAVSINANPTTSTVSLVGAPSNRSLVLAL